MSRFHVLPLGSPEATNLCQRRADSQGRYREFNLEFLLLDVQNAVLQLEGFSRLSHAAEQDTWTNKQNLQQVGFY